MAREKTVLSQLGRSKWELWIENSILKFYKNFVETNKFLLWKKAPIENKIIKYGRLYNSFVLEDERGILPEGWHIPTIQDWEETWTYCSENSIEFPDNSIGVYFNTSWTNNHWFWINKETIGMIGASMPHYSSFGYYNSKLIIRAVKDDSQYVPSVVIDGDTYHTVNINNKIWIVENLSVKHYNNGDLIENDFTGINGATTAFNDNEENIYTITDSTESETLIVPIDNKKVPVSEILFNENYNTVSNNEKSIWNSNFKSNYKFLNKENFINLDINEYSFLIIPGTYGVTFSDTVINDLYNERNFTLIVEFASNNINGEDNKQDIIHTLKSQSGRLFTRTIKYINGLLEPSDFSECYVTNSYLEENYVKNPIIEKITEYHKIEQNNNWIDITTNTKENVSIDLYSNGILGFDGPLTEDKSVLIQLKTINPEDTFKVKLEVLGNILLDEDNNEVELGNGITIFSVYSSVNNLWTITWASTVPDTIVENYYDVSVKKLVTSGGIRVSPQDNTRLYFNNLPGLSDGDLFFYNYGAHYFTGLYKVISSSFTSVYANRIAENTTLKVVRVLGDGIYYNQYDGTNLSTVSFIKLPKEVPYIYYNTKNNTLVVGENSTGQQSSNLKLSSGFDLELFSADVDIFGIDSAKLRSFGGASIMGSPVYVGEHTEDVISNDIPAGLTGLLLSPTDGYIKLQNNFDSIVEIGESVYMNSSSELRIESVGAMTLRNYDYMNVLSNGFSLSSTSDVNINSDNGVIIVGGSSTTVTTDNGHGLHILDGEPFYAGGYPRTDNVSLTYAGSGIGVDGPSSDVYLFSGGGNVKVFAEQSMTVNPPLYLEQGLFVTGSFILNTQFTPQNSSSVASTGTLFADNNYLYYKGTGNLLKRIAWTAF